MTKAFEDPSCVTLKVEGQLVAEWVGLVERECMNWQQKKGMLCVDLSHVMFVDGSGVAMIRRLMTNGVQLMGAEVLIADLYSAQGSLDIHESSGLNST